MENGESVDPKIERKRDNLSIQKLKTEQCIIVISMVEFSIQSSYNLGIPIQQNHSLQVIYGHGGYVILFKPLILTQTSGT